MENNNKTIDNKTRRYCLYIGLLACLLAIIVTVSPVSGGQPVLGSILQLIVMLALLAAIVVCVGPVIDFFASYVDALPADAAVYKNAVLPLYAWAYAFIALVVIIGFVAVYRNVIRTIIYGRWNE